MPQLANFVTAETSSLEMQAAIMSRQMDASFNPERLKRIREMWSHKLLVKSITRAEDAALRLKAERTLLGQATLCGRAVRGQHGVEEVINLL